MSKQKKYISLILVILVGSLTGCNFDSASSSSSSSTNGKPYSPIPANGSADEPWNLNLSWHSDGAVSYDVFFDENYPPQIRAFDDIINNLVPVPNPPLSPGKTHYWQVIANMPDGTSVEGSIWNFTTTLEGARFYSLRNLAFGTSLPNFVDVIFQVIDVHNHGVTTLGFNDFYIFDDGASIPISESWYQVNKVFQGSNIKTILLLDNSRSLLASDISQIRRDVVSLANQLLPGQLIDIYSFSDVVTPVILGASNATAIQIAVNALYNTGAATTDLYGAAEFGAIQVMESFAIGNIEQDFLIIFTDGDDTQGRRTFTDAMNAIGNKKVFTIGLGTDINPPVLEAMGNNGGYYPISQISELGTVLLDIQDWVEEYAQSYYELRYFSPKRGNVDHTLRIFILDNLNTGVGSFIDADYNSWNF